MSRDDTAVALTVATGSVWSGSCAGYSIAIIYVRRASTRVLWKDASHNSTMFTTDVISLCRILLSRASHLFQPGGYVSLLPVLL